MKSHLLIIRTLCSDDHIPSPTLVADLLDATLKVSGLRLTSIEVLTVGDSSTLITRRVRKITKPKKTTVEQMHKVE